MRFRVKLYHFLIIALLSIAIPAAIALAQSAVAGACKGSHTRKDFYQSVRMLGPATVLEVVGNRVNYAIAGEGIELGSLDIEDNYSIVPKDFAAKHSGCYGVTYCEKHRVVLYIEELPPKSCQIANN